MTKGEKIFLAVCSCIVSPMMMYFGWVRDSLVILLMGIFTIVFFLSNLFLGLDGMFEENYVEKVNQEELEGLLRKRDILINDIEKLQATLDEYNRTTIPGAAKNIYIQYVEKQLKEEIAELDHIERQLTFRDK